VFLASPGDLDVERRAAKEIVDELNATWCEYLGYHVELIGWEDTVAVFGRAQAVINLDVERCELFIGLLWKRWGTPPSKGGPYSSGFEEEFRISTRRRRDIGKPEISVFFKNVSPDQLRDPGPELQKVLAFKKELSDDNTVLYQTFGDAAEYSRKIVRCISQYIQRLLELERSQQADETRALPEGEQKDQSRLANQAVPTSPSEEAQPDLAAQFLRGLLDKGFVDKSEAATPLDVARFRLIGSSLGKHGNDDRYLGVHDANLLFAHRDDISLSILEMANLLETGCEHTKSQNVPTWHWYNVLGGTTRQTMALYTIAGADGKRAGILAAMKMIREPIYTANGFKRDLFTSTWLGKDSSSIVKVAALEYLGECGEDSDLQIVRQELDRKDYQTASAAIEALLRITLRKSRKDAVIALHELQPASLSLRVAEELFSAGVGLSSKTIAIGLSHKSSSVRRISLQILKERNDLTAEMADRMVADSEAAIRLEGLRAIELVRGQVTLARAKELLIKPKSGGFFGNPFASDSAGERCWEEFREERLSSMTDEELQQMAESETVYDRRFYFALAERQFTGKHGSDIRRAVADQYKLEFERLLAEREITSGKSSQSWETFKSLEESVRKQHTAQGLDIICRRGSKEDIKLVRLAMTSGFIGYSKAQVEFLRQHGTWADVSLIIEAIRRRRPGLPLLSIGDDDDRYEVATTAIYSLGRSRTEDILALDAPTKLRERLILSCPDAAFARISTATIRSLLHASPDDERRAAVLKCLKVLPRSRIGALLRDYMSEGEQRYYNVIYWLDFGLSFPRPRVLSIVARLIRDALARST